MALDLGVLTLLNGVEWPKLCIFNVWMDREGNSLGSDRDLHSSCNLWEVIASRGSFTASHRLPKKLTMNTAGFSR